MKGRFRGFGIYIFILVIIVLLWQAIGSGNVSTSTYTYAEFESAVAEGEVDYIQIKQNQQVPTGTLTMYLNDGSQERVVVSDVGEVENYLEEEGFTNYVLKDVPRQSVLITMLPSIIMMIVLIFMFMLMAGQAGGGGGNSKMMNFGKSRARMTNGENVNVKFKDVAGLREEKEELEGIVDFLKDPGKYTQLGARIPKGVLLVGPPGTGKTLIAKAVAGEAGVPFFSISGSDFVEMFVGVGASRVRDMFAEAKRHAPCIVFIDEIDAV